jgi:hypothetical protein
MYTPSQVKRVISVAESFAADAEDKAFWLSRPPLSACGRFKNCA